MKVNEQTVFERDPAMCPHEQPWAFSPEPDITVFKCRDCGAERAEIRILAPRVTKTRQELVEMFPEKPE